MISEVASKPCARLHEEITLHLNQVRVAGVSIQFVSVDGTAITLLPPLDQFQVETGAPDITIQVEWLRDLPMDTARLLFDSGYTWRLYEDGSSGFRFDFFAPVCGRLPFKRLLIDTHFSQARLQMNESSFAGMAGVPSPLEYPLDELLIMHRLTQEKAIELHSCGIVTADGAGNLFVGHSGGGKSTTTRLWTSREEVEVLSDDRIIVRLDDGRDGPAGPTGMRMYGTPWHGEAMFASPNSAPLSRIFILEHGHGNVITRLSPSQAVGELFARAFVPFHCHEYVESALSFLERVADSIPCYRYCFEPDERSVERILNFRD
jgi:hypothetical protein